MSAALANHAGALRLGDVMINARVPRVTSMLLLPALAASSACGLLGTGTEDSKVEIGTVRIVAFDHSGVPASRADVIAHDAYGEVFARDTVGDDGTGEVTSLAGGTVTIAIHTSDAASLLKSSGELVTFTDVPLDVTLRAGAPNPRDNDKTFDVTIVVPVRDGSPAYELTIGCDGNHFPPVQDSPEFVFHVPAGCATQPRTIIATALASNFGPAAISVLRDVELREGDTIEMPAYEPLRTVDLDIANHDSSGTFYLGRVTILDAGGSYEFIGKSEQAQGHITPQLPQNSDFELTRYERELVFDGGEGLIESIHHQIDAGAPSSTAITDADFLAPPLPGEGDFGFTFDGDVDARRLDLTWRCFKCDARGRWTLFGPSSQEPFTLPELPADLRSLSPEGAYINSIVGNIFENSDQDGYVGFLNASPDPVAGSTQRQALVVLRNDDI